MKLKEFINNLFSRTAVGTTDTESRSFVYTRINHDYISQKEIIPRVAMILDGYIAEEIIFSKEHITTGAESDIEKATEFLSSMILNKETNNK